MDSVLEDVEAAQFLSQMAAWNLNLIGSLHSVSCAEPISVCCSRSQPPHGVYVVLVKSVVTDFVKKSAIMWLKAAPVLFFFCFLALQRKSLFQLWGVLITGSWRLKGSETLTAAESTWGWRKHFLYFPHDQRTTMSDVRQWRWCKLRGEHIYRTKTKTLTQRKILLQNWMCTLTLGTLRGRGFVSPKTLR